MNLLKCCTVDDINSGKITAPGESDMKGQALEIERVDNLPNEFQGKNQQQQLAALRAFGPNWSLATTANLAKFAELKGRWTKIVEKDQELNQFSKTPIRLFLLKNNGWYLGQCVEKDRDNKIYERQGIGHYLDHEGNYFLCCWEKDLQHKFGLHLSLSVYIIAQKVISRLRDGPSEILLEIFLPTAEKVVAFVIEIMAYSLSLVDLVVSVLLNTLTQIPPIVLE